MEIVLRPGSMCGYEEDAFRPWTDYDPSHPRCNFEEYIFPKSMLEEIRVVMAFRLNPPLLMDPI